MALQLHQIIDGFLKKVECRVGKEFGNGYNIETNKVSQISCFFSCFTSEGPACQGADESRHGSWTKRGLISTSSKVRAQLDQTMQPPPFQTKAFTIPYIKQTGVNLAYLMRYDTYSRQKALDRRKAESYGKYRVSIVIPDNEGVN